MTTLSNLKVYATHPHDCSYLPNQQATTLFIDPQTTVDNHLYSQLAVMGFRRSGSHIYRPHCGECSACIASRVPVADFEYQRKQRKIRNRNQDLTIKEVNDISDNEYYDLYARYISERHSDGDMFPPSKDQYLSFLTKEWGMTKFYSFRDGKELLAVAIIDEMNNGIAAVYTFFDPDNDRRSLGSYAILWQIEHAKSLNLPHVYLGYWIKECRKMNYKTDYRPLELLINDQWLRMS
ncbi:MAG: arginyl-tRNA--protein-N-Asp/Glu arginylyltransferase [Oceanicoccus sp.]|jgi:arginyl-tRNA--protein-N-Asp/Glu arginylyltransferase